MYQGEVLPLKKSFCQKKAQQDSAYTKEKKYIEKENQEERKFCSSLENSENQSLVQERTQQRAKHREGSHAGINSEEKSRKKRFTGQQWNKPSK